jgi:hypothetical protein
MKVMFLQMCLKVISFVQKVLGHNDLSLTVTPLATLPPLGHVTLLGAYTLLGHITSFGHSKAFWDNKGLLGH